MGDAYDEMERKYFEFTERAFTRAETLFFDPQGKLKEREKKVADLGDRLREIQGEEHDR